VHYHGEGLINKNIKEKQHGGRKARKKTRGNKLRKKKTKKKEGKKGVWEKKLKTSYSPEMEKEKKRTPTWEK